MHKHNYVHVHEIMNLTLVLMPMQTYSSLAGLAYIVKELLGLHKYVHCLHIPKLNYVATCMHGWMKKFNQIRIASGHKSCSI